MTAIPVIDLAIANTPNLLSVALVDAITRFGFFYLKNTIISPDEIKQLFSISQDFFAHETAEEKLKCPHVNNKGYAGLNHEILDAENDAHGDTKESINIGMLRCSPGQYIPARLSLNQIAIERFQDKCIALSRTLLEAFGIALGIDSEFFGQQHDLDGGKSSILRLLHYPAIEAGKSLSANRAGAHSDYGSLTLLFQSSTPSLRLSSSIGTTGLQILPSASISSTPEWISVPFVPDAILANVGDLMEYWSHGRFRSTLHRVRIPGSEEGGENELETRLGAEERYSIAFFCHPRGDARLMNLVQASEVSEDDVERMEKKGIKMGTELSAHEHLLARLRATSQA